MHVSVPAFCLNVEIRRVHGRKREHTRSSNKMLKAFKGISVLLLWLGVGHGHDLAFPSLLVVSNQWLFVPLYSPLTLSLICVTGYCMCY